MEYTVTIAGTNPYAGSSAASGSYYNISSTDNMNGVSTPRASNITWTFAIPTNIPWAVCKIKSAYVKNVRVYNSSSSRKDASWVFRTNYYGSGWRSSVATVGDAVVWRYHGMNNGSWHPGDTTTTYNNVTMTSNAIKWIQSQFSEGKNLYFSYIEARSAGGSITSPDYSGTTYSTRFYHSYKPSIVITYEMQPCYVFTNKGYSATAAGSWQVAIPYVYTNSAWTQAVPSVYTNSAWNPG